MNAVRFGLAAALALVSSNVSAQTVLSTRSSAEEAVNYAIISGCLPFLAEGGDLLARVSDNGRRETTRGVPSVRLNARQRVVVQELEGRACHIQVDRGDAVALRQAVLEAMTRAGVQPRAFQDSGDDLSQPGRYRQEGYCIAVRQGAAFVMSTATDRVHPALQLSLILDSAEPCGIPTAG